MRKGEQRPVGLPLAEFDHLDLVKYTDLHFTGWDLYQDDLYKAAEHHKVLDREQLAAVKEEMSDMYPLQAHS